MLSDYVLEQRANNSITESIGNAMKFTKEVVKYTKFLKEEIEQWMFVGEKSIFLNYSTPATRAVAESGEMLVIYTARDATAIQPYIQWKTENGFKVTPQQVATGTNVKSTILNAYNANKKLLYVQLVGDWEDIKSDIGTSQKKPMDPMLGCVTGSDKIPDLIIGRFSAKSAADVTTQINKAINYEKTPDLNATWYSNAIGIGSNEGDGAGDDGRHGERSGNARGGEVQAAEQPIDELRALDQVPHEQEQRHRDEHVVRHHAVGALHHQVEHLGDRELRIDAAVGEPGEENAHAHQRERGREAEHDGDHDQREHQKPEHAEVGLAQVRVYQVAPRREHHDCGHDQGHEPEAEPQLLADDHRGLSLVT